MRRPLVVPPARGMERIGGILPKKGKWWKIPAAGAAAVAAGMGGKELYDSYYDVDAKQARQEELLRYLLMEGGPTMSAMQGGLEQSEGMESRMMEALARAAPTPRREVKPYRAPTLRGLISDSDLARLEGLRIKAYRTLDELLAEQGIY